ncbi:prepilin peptidase [Micavibrio aeruginosavorus]|uniref:prepilin peptidase n=1 Tax=Micavibrio aeruginosavorus TaxID=349221 RepID=UPI003F4A8E22
MSGVDARTALEILFVLMFGLCCGSFATALIWRIPRGVSWIVAEKGAARSACPHCQTPLTLWDLIPVFSWVFLRGRCRHCHKPIGWIYPTIELSTLLLCLGVYALWGYNAPGGIVMLTIPFLVALFVIDVRHFILPDQLNALVGVLGVIYQFVLGGAEGAGFALLAGVIWGACAFVLGFLMKKILKKEALGLGDVKFFVVAGIWLPAVMAPPFLMWSGVLGVGLALIWKITGRGAVFPFGPALIVAFGLCLALTRVGLGLDHGLSFGRLSY